MITVYHMYIYVYMYMYIYTRMYVVVRSIYSWSFMFRLSHIIPAQSAPVAKISCDARDARAKLQALTSELQDENIYWHI